LAANNSWAKTKNEAYNNMACSLCRLVRHPPHSMPGRTASTTGARWSGVILGLSISKRTFLSACIHCPYGLSYGSVLLRTVHVPYTNIANQHCTRGSELQVTQEDPIRISLTDQDSPPRCADSSSGLLPCHLARWACLSHSLLSPNAPGL